MAMHSLRIFMLRLWAGSRNIDLHDAAENEVLVCLPKFVLRRHYGLEYVHMSYTQLHGALEEVYGFTYGSQHHINEEMD